MGYCKRRAAAKRVERDLLTLPADFRNSVPMLGDVLFWAIPDSPVQSC